MQNRIRDSDACMPSKAFNRPLRVRVLVSADALDSASSFFASGPIALLLSGVPEESESREVDRVNAASISSRSRIDRAGMRPNRVVKEESLTQLADNDTTYTSKANSPAIA